MRYELYLNRYHLGEDLEEWIIPRFEFKFIREGKIIFYYYYFPFRLVFNPFLKSDCFWSGSKAFVLKKNLERSLSQKDKFFPLEQFDWKKEKEITIQNVKLFFYRFQSEEIYTYVRLYTIITHIPGYFPRHDRAIVVRGIYFPRALYSLPPILPGPASSRRCCNIAVLLFYARRGGRVCRNFGTRFRSWCRLSRVNALKMHPRWSNLASFLFQMDFSLTPTPAPIPTFFRALTSNIIEFTLIGFKSNLVIYILFLNNLGI